MIIGPLDPGGQAHQYALNAAIGTKAEQGALVVYEVEFDVSAPTDLLPSAFLSGIGYVFAFLGYGYVGLQEAVPDSGYEVVPVLCSAYIGRPQIVKKQAPNPPCLIPVGVPEVFIAAFLIGSVEVGVVTVAGFLANPVEMPGIFFVKVIGSQILTSSEPLVFQGTVRTVQFEIPIIGMHGWDLGTARVEYEAQTAGEEACIADPEIILHAFGQFTVHFGDIHSAFLEDAPVLDHTGPSTSSAFSLPVVLTKSRFSIEFFQSVGYTVLQILDVRTEFLLHAFEVSFR
jgi:hypothetical protein